MIGGGDLGESFRFGAVCFVASGAQYGSIQLGRLYGSRIFGMPGEPTVAGLARHSGMDAVLLLVRHIAVARLTCLVSSKGDRPRGNFTDCIAAEMPIFPKTPGHDCTPEDHKGNHCYGDHSRQPQEVLYVFEGLH